MENSSNIPKELEVQTKCATVTISDRLMIMFVHVPEVYQVKNFKLEKHTTYKIGRLNNFNKSKLLKGDRCRVTFFTNILKKGGWDFEQFPNPVAYACYIQK